MTVTDLISELSQNGVHLAADGERLVVNAPKGVLSDEHRALLAAHKPELLLLLRDRREQTAPDARTIVPDPVARFEPFPLTDIQQAYWIGRAPTMDLGGVGCHAYRELESADVDVARLESAWNRLVERHDMLRAVFLENGTQRILPSAPHYDIAVTDLRDRADDDAQCELADIRESMSHRLFDPTQWPLFDLRATQLPNGRTRIHISLDLLIADAASMLLLFREWESFYADPAFDPDPLTVTFRDYVLDGERRKQHDAYKAAERHWQARLGDFPPPPKLPLAKAPSMIARPHFTRRGSRMEADAWSRFKRRAADAGLTPSAAVCAAYADVLSLWSNSRRFAVTLTLFRGGSHAQMASVIGDFTSTILLEAETTAPTFELRAQRLQSRLADDIEHSAVSGVQVLRELNRARRETNITAVPVVFTSALGHRNVEGKPKPPLAWLGTTEFAITQTPQVWIDHHVYEEEGALIFSWDALDELFPPRMLDEMFDAYAAFLHGLAEGEAAWQQRLGALLPESQQSRHAAANATDGALPDELLHAGFLRQANARPDARAVVAHDRTLTYGELETLSRAWAAQIRARGAAPNQLVAVIMEKGWEQAVAVLAILRAGAAYLPIDPALPALRVAELLRDGAVSLALTQEQLAKRIELPAEVEQLVIGASTPLIADADEDPASPGDLAYVIYTSGSTGMPKGVMIDHRAACNTVADINERFAVTADDRVLALSALNFDLSVYDIFGMLAAGGTIVFPPPDATRNPQVWWELIDRERVTVWNSVPALMELLAEWRGGGPLDSLRVVMLSGDWIPLTLPPRIQSVAPRAALCSLGGATEASIWSIAYPIDGVQPEWSSIPYGRALRNQRFHVLSDDFEECPDLVAGRLFIGGAGLARGYWHDEAKTNAKFFVNPRTGERIYDTGDLGRWMPDGNIEFLGREDQQVKIQGHRIELGEIEAALLAHPRVRSAAVHTTGEKEKRRLVGYAVLDDDSAQRLEFKLAHHGLRTFVDAEQVALPPLADAHPLLTSRRTQRRFSGAPVPLESFGALLGALMERTLSGDALPKRLYPSAGDTYPIQVYLHVKAERVDGLDAGTYYYDPAAHRLVLITRGAAIDRQLHAANNRTAFDEAAFSIFLVAEMNAIAPLYGPLARDFALLESGYAGQLLMTAAAQAGLALCPIGTVEAAPIATILQLGATHELLHSFVGGPPADAAQQRPMTIVEELRAHLRARLPESMVPADIVMLSELPLSANGKVDRSRLPAPRAERPRTTAAPSSETARTLARIVAEILGVDAIAPDDNFFDAGANSLHMVQLHRRIGEELHAEIPLVDLFRHSSVHFLAERLGDTNAVQPSIADEGRRRAEARLAAKQRRTQ